MLQNLAQQLDGIARIRKIEAGTIVMYQGEIPQNAFVVKSGILKAFTVNNEGYDRIVNFIVSGEFFPFAWVFGKSSICLSDYQAITDCELYEISYDNLHVALSDKKSQADVFDWLITNYTSTQLRITALEQAKARDKILYTMYFLMKRFGKRLPGEWYLIEPKLTHQMIADLVGLTRETTAIELNTIKKERAISYKQQKYLVHKTTLEKLIGEENITGLSASL